VFLSVLINVNCRGFCQAIFFIDFGDSTDKEKITVPQKFWREMDSGLRILSFPAIKLPK